MASRNLSNPILARDWNAAEDLTDSHSRIGYKVQDQDGTIHVLAPMYDAAGFGADIGDVVEVSALGLGHTCQVIGKIRGYRGNFESKTRMMGMLD